MVNEKISWTKSLKVGEDYIDPSSVQEASTSLQTHLFPGMSTLTKRVRYISLLAAAKYYRMEAGLDAELPLSLSDYLHRFEALIAVSSIMHHTQDNTSFDGIIGRNAARAPSKKSFS